MTLNAGQTVPREEKVGRTMANEQDELLPADDGPGDTDTSPEPARGLSVSEPVAVRTSSGGEEVPAPRKRRPRPPMPPQTVVVQQPRSALSTCALYSGLALLVMVVVGAFVTLMFADSVTDFADNMIGDVRTFLGLEAVTPEVANTQIIVLGIRNMALLQTTSGDLLIEKEVVEDQPLRKDPFVKMRYIGRITAGIDLSAISTGDIVIGPERSVTVTLPPAQLTGCYLENAAQLDASCGTTFLGLTSCTDKLNELQQVAQRRARDDLIDMASELDVVEQAYAAAETAVRALLTDLGFESVRFERSDAEAPVDPSCQP